MLIQKGNTGIFRTDFLDFSVMTSEILSILESYFDNRDTVLSKTYLGFGSFRFGLYSLHFGIIYSTVFRGFANTIDDFFKH